MTEVLGDAVLDLTVDLGELVGGMDEARALVKTDLDAMARDVQGFVTKASAAGQELDRLFLDPLSRAFAKADIAAGSFDGTLGAVEATTRDVIASLEALALTAEHMSDGVSRALENVRSVSDHTAASIVAASAAERMAIDSVTHAYERLAAAQALVGATSGGGPAPLRVPNLSDSSRWVPPPALPGGSSGPMIWGSRGTGAPGSIQDPVVVAIESGQYAGLGSRAAALGFTSTPTPEAPSSAASADVLALLQHLREVYQPAAYPGANVARSTLGTFIARQPSDSMRPQLPPSTSTNWVIWEPGGGGHGGPFFLPSGGGGGGGLGWRPTGQAPDDRLLDYVHLAGLLETAASSGRKAYAAGPGDPLYRRPSFIGGGPGEPTVRLDSAEYAGLYEAMRAGGGGPSVAGFLPPAGGTGGGAGGGGGGPFVGGMFPPGDGGGRGPSFLGSLLAGGAASKLLWGGGARWGGGGWGRWWMPAIAGAGFGSLGSFAGLGPEHILMTALGIAGSATTGAAGAGLLGLGALGQSAVGQGSDTAVMKSTIADTQTLAKGLTQIQTAQAQAAATGAQYQAAVKQYGASSQQATQALSSYHTALGNVTTAQANFNAQANQFGGAKAPGVAAEIQLAKQSNALNTFWDQQTQLARVAAVHILEQVVHLGHDYVPLIANAARMNLTIINTGLKPLFAWLEGPQGMGIFNNLENNFRHNLPNAIHAFDQGLEALLRITSIASNYTGGFIQEMDRLATRLNAQPNAVLQTWVQRLIGDFRIWEQFIKAIGTDLYLLFRNDAATGQTIIVTLTQMLNKLGEYERSTRGMSQLHSLFEVHKQEVLALLHILPILTSTLGPIYMAVAPVATAAFTTLAEAITAVVKGVEALGPVATNLLGFALIAGKLGILSNVLHAVGVGLGLTTAKIGETEALTGALNANTAALSGNTVAAAENATAMGADAATTGAADAARGAGLVVPFGGFGAPGLTAGKFGFTAMGGAMTSGLATKLGLSEAGAASLATGGGALLAGGAGLLGGSILQQATGLRGGAGGTIGGGLAGAGLGLALSGVIGPLGPVMGSLLGSGIGSTLGPTLGHLLNSIFGSSGPNYGKRFAEGFIHPWQGIVSTTLGHEMQAAIHNAYDALHRAQQAHPEVSGPRGGQYALPQTAAEQHKVEMEAYHFGVTIAQQTERGLNSVPIKSTAGLGHLFSGDLQRSFSAKAGQLGAAAAAATDLNYAEGLVKAGQLPKRAVEQLLVSLEGQFPGITKYLNAWGYTTGQQIARAFNLHQAEGNLATSLENIRKNVAGASLAIDRQVTPENLFGNVVKAGQFLQNVIDTSVGQSRDDAVQAFHDLRNKAKAILSGLASDVQHQMKTIHGHISQESALAQIEGSSAFHDFAAAASQFVAAGAYNVGQASAIIIRELNKALKELHQPQLTPIQVEQVQFSVDVQSSYAAGHVPGKFTPHGATGMMVSAPMYVVGEEAPTHPEYVLATNPAYRSKNLNLWAMAGHDLGIPGFAQGGVYGFGQLEGLWDRAGGSPQMAATMAAIALAESSGNADAHNASGASGLWQILGLPFPGNVYDPLTNARMAVAKLLSQGLGAWATYTSGAYRHFLGGAAGFGGGLPHILAPRVKGAGPFASLARAGGSLLADAANAYLGAHAPAGIGGGGAPFHHGKFVFPLPSGAWVSGSLDQGWDLSAPAHTPEFAIGAGTIVGHGIGGFGKWAPILRLDNGGGEVYYGHAGPGHWTPTGAHVRAGQVISEVGAGIVGLSTGPHLEIGWYPPGSASGRSMQAALGYRVGGRRGPAFMPHYRAGTAHAAGVQMIAGRPVTGHTRSGTPYSGSGSSRTYYYAGSGWTTGSQLDRIFQRRAAQAHHAHPGSTAAVHHVRTYVDPLDLGGFEVGSATASAGEGLPLGHEFGLLSEGLGDLTPGGFSAARGGLARYLNTVSPDRAYKLANLGGGLINTRDKELLTEIARLREDAKHHHKDASTDRKKIREANELLVRRGLLEDTLINHALAGVTKQFTNQQTGGQNFSSLASALGGLSPGTGLGLSRVQLKAIGLTRGQVGSLEGTGPGAYATQANELSGLAAEYGKDAVRLTRLYKEALKTHNKKLEKSLLGELDAVTTAEVQARSDLQAAQVNQINAIFSKAQSTTTTQQGGSDILSAIQNLTPGADISALGPALAQIEKAAGFAPGTLTGAGEGTGLSYYQNLSSMQGGLTAAQLAAAQQSVNTQNSTLAGQISTDQGAINQLMASLNSGTLSPDAAKAAQDNITQLVTSILGLDSTMQSNTSAVQQLTTATNANTSATGAMTGTVAYNYGGQDWLASTTGPNVGVGI